MTSLLPVGAAATWPLVSVVVIGRNEGERLLRCLDAIERCDRSRCRIEVIYVDSSSSDGSPQRAADRGVRVLQVQPLRPSAALGRNAGWQAAAGDLVLFLDGDTELHPDFLRHALAALEPEVAVIWGHRRESRPQQSWFVRVLDLDWIYPAGDSEFCGGDALMRRAVLQQVRGFDEQLIAGEEPEMCRRIRAAGHRIVHLDVPMTRHDLALTTWSAYWRRAFRAGHAYAEVSARCRDGPDPLWRRESRRNLLHGGFLLLAPLLLALIWVLLPFTWALGLTSFGALTVLALLGRSARRCAWKSADRATCWWYAVHSHLQQVPILLGQLAQKRDARRGRRRQLIEYKTPSGRCAVGLIPPNPKMALKSLLATALWPFASLTDQPLAAWWRLWAYTRLRAAVPGVEPSVVVLGMPELHGTRRIRLGRNLYLYPGLYLETQEAGRIEIGDGVVMSRGVHVVAFDRVSIGDGSLIGEYASLRDANHRHGEGLDLRHSGHEARPIRIGRQVWIGRGAVVLAGVEIGDGAVVGANAVVTRSVAAGQVVVGVPARPLSRPTAGEPA